MRAAYDNLKVMIKDVKAEIKDLEAEKLQRGKDAEKLKIESHKLLLPKVH